MSARLDRFELKFVITGEQRAALMPELMPHLRADENALEGAYYPVVSMYYDDDDRESYWQHQRAYPSRRKLRVRIYGTSGALLPPTCFVEIKHRCESRVAKRRLNLPLEECMQVAAGEQPTSRPLKFFEQRIVDEVHGLVRQGYKPCCTMRYDRLAFADREPGSNLRVTFDTGIAFRMDHLTPAPDDRAFTQFLLPEGYAVMEVKDMDCIPYWITSLVARHGCILQSHSKYSNAMEDGDPVLHRMLGGQRPRRHYGLTPQSVAPVPMLNVTIRPEPAVAAS